MKNLPARKLLVSEHSATTNGMINFEDASVVKSCNRCSDRLVLEATEITKHKGTSTEKQ